MLVLFIMFVAHRLTKHAGVCAVDREHTNDWCSAARLRFTISDSQTFPDTRDAGNRFSNPLSCGKSAKT